MDESESEAVRVIPVADGGRVESGLIQLGDDAPGLWLRGEDATELAAVLRRAVAAFRATGVGGWKLRGDLDRWAALTERAAGGR